MYKGFTVKRKSTNEILFDTTNHPTYFNEEYIELTTSIPTLDIFGLGERNYKLKLEPGTYTIYIVDEVGSIEKGVRGYSTHGHHPVYLMREKSGKFHMAFFRSGNPMAITIREDHTLTWRVVGGIIDMEFISCGKFAEECIETYHEYIGEQHLPPFWALGYHQGRWGYKNFDDLVRVMDDYNAANVPFDTLWNDIDYQNLSNILRRETWHTINFSYDKSKFPPD